jgi:hypothetical protein
LEKSVFSSFSVRPDGTTSVYIDGQLVQSFARKSNAPPNGENARGRSQNSNPEIFKQSKLKISRAKYHVSELDRAWTEFRDTVPYDINIVDDKSSQESVFLLDVRHPVPDHFSVILGDAIHNLRSALDYLICDLARSAGQTRCEQNGFPIKGKAQKFKSGTTRKLKGISPRAERLVLAIKSIENLNYPLHLLNSLDVLDKHNSLVITTLAVVDINVDVGLQGVNIGPNGTFRLGGGGQQFLSNAGQPSHFTEIYPIVDRLEVHRCPNTIHNYVELSVSLCFGDSDIIEIGGKNVFDTLDCLIEYVERVIGVFERTCA